MYTQEVAAAVLGLGGCFAGGRWARWSLGKIMHTADGTHFGVRRHSLGTSAVKVGLMRKCKWDEKRKEGRRGWEETLPAAQVTDDLTHRKRLISGVRILGPGRHGESALLFP